MDKRQECSSLFIDVRQFDELDELCIKLRFIRELSLVRKSFSELNNEACSDDSSQELPEEFEQFGSDIQIENYQGADEMKDVFQLAKKVWKALNSDITPALKSISNELAAICEPQLVPVKVEGMTIEWIDKRTGKRPLFS